MIFFKDILGGPLKFWPSVLFYGTPIIDVLLHFKKGFSEIRDLCCSRGPNFTRKICRKFDTFSDFFFQKINVLRVKMVLNGNIFKKFAEISYKLHTGHFGTFLKILKIWPPKLPKIHFLLHF